MTSRFFPGHIMPLDSIWFTTDDARLDLELCAPPSSNTDAGLDCQISSFVLSLRRFFSCSLEAISSADSFDKQKPLIMSFLQKHCHFYSWQCRWNHSRHYGQILQCHWTFDNGKRGFIRVCYTSDNWIERRLVVIEASNLG